MSAGDGQRREEAHGPGRLWQNSKSLGPTWQDARGPSTKWPGARGSGSKRRWQANPPYGFGPSGWRRLSRPSAWAGVRRPAEGRLLAGVAKAFADHSDFDVLAVRAAFVALSFVGGLGIAVYMAAWLVLPSGPTTAGAEVSRPGTGTVGPEDEPVGTGLEGAAGPGPAGPSTVRAEAAGAVGVSERPAGRYAPPEQPIFRAAMADRRTVGLVAGVASAIIALLVALSALGGTVVVGAVSPGAVALAALAAVWRHAGTEDRAAARRLANLLTAARPEAASSGKKLALAALRVSAGAALIAIGTSHFFAPQHLNGADIAAALSALGTVGGFCLVLAPWWLRLGRELVAERRNRARAEERAEMAAQLHDSVLQTLALIQRSADDPHQVRRLARAQERQLRSWLFDRDSTPSPGDDRSGSQGTAAPKPATFGAALRAVQQEVEDAHGTFVEVVTVGDVPLDERLEALVAAAREGVVNAAKWSGAGSVSVYAEIGPKSASVFVRDRGCGFDPAQVPKDRRGISESLKGRMRRHGGSAKVRSAPGEGTEITLEMPMRRDT